MRRRLETPLRWIAALLVACCALAPAGAARADALDDARAAGLVGEQPDGYVGLVEPNAPAAVKALVENVNKRRALHYAAIAKREGTNATAVAALAGAKLVERAPAGHYVMDDAGNWKKK